MRRAPGCKQRAPCVVSRALLTRKDKSIEWYDNEQEAVVVLPIGDKVTKRQMDITFKPRRVVVKVSILACDPMCDTVFL